MERAFWTAEQKNRIFREDVIDELKGVPPKSRSGSVVNGETGSRPSTTLSDYMFPRTQRQPQAQKQPQNQTQNESHYQQMPQHQQPQQPMPQQPSKPVPQYQQMPQHQPYQQQHAMPPRRVPDSKQEFITNLLRANPGHLTYICLLCYNAENKVRERVDDNDWCMKKHQFPDCFMLALFNLTGTKLLKLIREPPDESLSGGSSFQLCRAPLDPRTQKCAKRFCTFPHSEVELEVWNFCVREKVDYFSLANANRPRESPAAHGNSPSSYQTSSSLQQHYSSTSPSQGARVTATRIRRPPSNNSSRTLSPSNVSNADYKG